MGLRKTFFFPRWKQSRQIENERQFGCNLNVGTDPLKSRLDLGNASGAERSSHLERAHLIHIDLSAIARSLNRPLRTGSSAPLTPVPLSHIHFVGQDWATKSFGSE